MDAAHYARVRELFLAAEELPAEEHRTFLEQQVGDDRQLFDDVMSLLAEHDADSARLEGQRATPVQPPPSTVRPDSAERRLPSGERSGHDRTTHGGHAKSSEATQVGSQRTHASPRYTDTPDPRSRRAGANLWAQQARRRRRSNSGWLWLAAVLPTALIGWWTYRQVEVSIRESVRQEMSSVANSVTIASAHYLDTKAQLIESWSRQPVIRKAILDLVAIDGGDSRAENLRAAPHSDLIKAQLQELSGRTDVKYVVWDRTLTTLASWQDDRGDVGNRVAQSGAVNIFKALGGETVLFGPERLLDNTVGFVPETNRPVMANLVPIRDDKNNVVAALLVRGIGMFDEFDRIFSDVGWSGGLDVYAVNRDGYMLTNSPHAIELHAVSQLELEPDELAGGLRVSDPGVALREGNLDTVDRQSLPLTVAVAGARSGQSNVRIVPYNNYSGQPVVGAWRWNPDWELGIVIERNFANAFATAKIVRFSFLLLGGLLTVTAFFAAWQIARKSTLAHAAVHPLSRYEISKEPLGGGGMGVVFRAKHKQLGRDTAVKVLRSDRQQKEDQLRFDREAKLAASLSNPHSVSIYDYGRSDEGESFCVMEFLKGITLYEVVMRSGHQPYGRVLFVLRQICDALVEAHGLNLLHRDIKPQNVMLSLDPAVGDWAVVFDYGLAKPLKPDAGTYQTSETVWAGTPMYMAPERFREPNVMDPRSDLYSVGCVAYFLLSGRPPYVECEPESLFALIISEDPISIATHRDEPVPDEILELVQRCMAKDVNDRYESFIELSRVIDDLRAKYPWTVEEARVWWKAHGEEV